MQNLKAKIRMVSFIMDEEAQKDLIPLTSCKTDRTKIARPAREMVTQLRNSARKSVMELFLMEYGLLSEEGMALMYLAEALHRVPDGTTIDALIENKISPPTMAQTLRKKPVNIHQSFILDFIFNKKSFKCPGTELSQACYAGR